MWRTWGQVLLDDPRAQRTEPPRLRAQPLTAQLVRQVPAPGDLQVQVQRFFTVRGSSTRRNEIRGPAPSGSLIAATSPHSSAGTSWWTIHASQVANPVGGGAGA